MILFILLLVMINLEEKVLKIRIVCCVVKSNVMYYDIIEKNNDML